MYPLIKTFVLHDFEFVFAHRVKKCKTGTLAIYALANNWVVLLTIDRRKYYITNKCSNKLLNNPWIAAYVDAALA